ncbi:MAG: S-layer homology domain-containing protein [Oscillospiraceae bacterium]|nr:S-layer homology domain-containing protein [Oscillospiraceae bacterium]
MKKSLCLLLTLTALCLLAMNAFAVGLSFSDVKETDWFADAVSEAVALGLINGKGVDSYGRNYFDPDGNITLAEAVKLAACMHQRSAEGAVTLTNGNPWYESYADYGRDRFLAASGKGFSYDSVMASPNRIINRAEFAWLFAHAVPASALPEVNAIPDNAIPDVKSGSELYYDEIYTLYRAGIVKGSDENGSFLPASNIKRSEVAAIVVRMMEPEKRVGPPEKLGEAPLVDFTLEDLIKQNSIPNLMKRHSCVTVRSADAAHPDEGVSYWMVGDTVVYTDVWYYQNERQEMGAYGDFAYSVTAPGQMRAKLWVMPSSNPYDDAISSAFPIKLTEDIKIQSYDAETLTIQLIGEAPAGEAVTVPIEMKAVISRKSHELLSYSSTIVYSAGNINHVEKILEYDGPAVGTSVMAGWDKTRVISIETEPYVWGTYPTELTCPANWDLTIVVHPGYGVKISVAGFETDDYGEFHVSTGDKPISVVVHG